MQILSLHEKWHVFRGESTDFKDLLFIVGRSTVIQLKTTLNVYLASNTKEDACDFKVKGSWLERACVVYAGESSTIVAQVRWLSNLRRHRKLNYLTNLCWEFSGNADAQKALHGKRLGREGQVHGDSLS